MKTRRKKFNGTPSGREIIAALADLCDTLAAGIPLEEKYTVRHVDAPAPSTDDAQSARAVKRKPYEKTGIDAGVKGRPSTGGPSGQRFSFVPLGDA